MTDKILINRDVLVFDILDKLPVPALLNFLAANKALKERLLPYLQEKIDDYAEYLKHRREVAKPKRMENIESLYATANILRNYQIYIIDKTLVDFMEIGHMPRIEGDILYNAKLLNYWWKIYISQLVGYLVKEDDQIRLNNEMAHLILFPTGVTMTVNEFLQQLLYRYAHAIDVVRAADELGIPSNMIERIMFAFAEEYRELFNAVIFLTQQNVKDNTLPSGYSSLVNYSYIR